LQAAGLTVDGFQVQAIGPGGSYHLEASADLRGWSTIDSTNAPPGPVLFVDREALLFDSRFYRVRLQ